MVIRMVIPYGSGVDGPERLLRLDEVSCMILVP